MTWAYLSKTCINTGGVVLATAGACLLWYFVGDVMQVNRKEILKGESAKYSFPSASPGLQRRIRTHIWLSRLGVFLTVCGGALQLVSNYMSE